MAIELRPRSSLLYVLTLEEFKAHPQTLTMMSHMGNVVVYLMNAIIFPYSHKRTWPHHQNGSYGGQVISNYEPMEIGAH
jgi:hypothetical protein